MKGLRYILASMLGALLVLLIGGSWLAGASAELAAITGTLFSNGSFELGDYAQQNEPHDWQSGAFVPGPVFTWRDDIAQQGEKSVQITAGVANDAYWTQTVDVETNSTYFFSGWIKTENVVSTASSDPAGANLCVFGTSDHTAGLTGTNDWTFVSMLVETGGSTELTLCARLGYASDATSGTAWFDNLKFFKLDPNGPMPTWNVLVLVYQLTDFTYTDSGAVEHRVIASMTTNELQQAAQAAQDFVNTDVPALSSGHSQPQVTVRYPTQTINDLTPYNTDTWWLGSDDIAQDLDPAFDSVIVVWDSAGTNIKTGTPEDLSGGEYETLSPDRGTGQTYTLLTAGAALTPTQRNAFKFAYGGSLLNYFDAAGTAPKPKVDNDPGPSDYVNCDTGQPYVWQEETLTNPIPNSIFNNDSGFTHDYYSGMTALAGQPTECLGITPVAWAAGGPVAGPLFYDLEAQVIPTAQMGDPGTAVNYTLRLDNRGTVSDTYQISYSGNSWPVSGPAASPEIDPDQTWEAPVVVTIPVGTDALATDMLQIDILSDGDNGISGTLTLTTTANAIYSFNAAALSTELGGDPGTSVNYTLQISNTGNLTDSYDLVYNGNVWPTNGPAAVGPIAPDSSESIAVVVEIPSAVDGLDADNVSVTLTSQGNNALEQQIGLTTTANAHYDFTATADATMKSDDAGATVTYDIEITNQGNIADTYSVTYNGNTWPVSGAPAVGPIARGFTDTLQVEVEIPTTALGMETDQVDVLLTSQGDSATQQTLQLTTEANSYYGLELTPTNLDAMGLIGTTQHYQLTVKNVGNVSDSFTIETSNQQWDVQLPSEVGPLNPQQSVDMVILVTIPEDAADGEQDTVLITARSQGDPKKFGIAGITTTARWALHFFPAMFR